MTVWSLRARQGSREEAPQGGHRDGGGASVATTLFRDTTYSTYGLIESIKRGAVALPEPTPVRVAGVQGPRPPGLDVQGVPGRLPAVLGDRG